MKQSTLSQPQLELNHINQQNQPESNWMKQLTTYTSLILLGAGIGLGGNYLINSSQLLALNPKIQEILPEESIETPKLLITLILSLK